MVLYSFGQTTLNTYCSYFQLYTISSNQKADLMRLMNEAVQVLRPGSDQDDVDYRDLVSQATSFRKILSQVKPASKDAQNGTTLTWQANGKALVTYKVFRLYSKVQQILNLLDGFLFLNDIILKSLV